MSKTLKKSLFIAALLLLNGLSHAQTVTGKVSDSNGSIPGVNVQVQNSNINTETDVDGKYTLSNLPKNAILNFSYIGFASQSVKVNSQTTINIVLALQDVSLQEVVVVGYGRKSKQEYKPIDIEFQKIKIESIVNVKFKLE